MIAACACHKENHNITDMPITMSAKEAVRTKGLLDAEKFAYPGSQLRIYDYYTPTSGDPYYYINGGIAESDGTMWPFKESYRWTTDGVHKFFGWLEQGDNLKINQLFTPTFEDQTLTIPETTIGQTGTGQTGTAQFDFMYSDIHVRDLNNSPYFTAVPLEFSHLFTAFKITTANYSSNDVWLKKVSINGLRNTKGATIDYRDNEQPQLMAPAVTITEPEGAEPANFVYNVSETDEGMLMTKKQTYNISDDFQIMWPQSRADFENAEIVVDYKYREPSGTSALVGETKIPLKDMFSWESGQKNNLALTFKDKEISLTCKVEPWTVVEETIDFTNQISVSNPLTWVPNSVESIDYENGEVVLYSDSYSVAICNFHIDTPAGATWTASLIPVEGHADAFKILDNTKYGAVGVDSEIHIQVTNMAPYAPKHVVLLRITVQTADGRTIVADMMPNQTDEGITEYKLIQNII